MSVYSVQPRLGVPRVARAGAAALAHEAPVLEVVDRLEHGDRAVRLPEEHGDARPAGDDGDRSHERRLDDQPDDHVAPPESPGAAKLRRHRAQEERLIALAEARGRRIVGRGDAHVMAADVLDEEVIVEHRAQKRAPEPAQRALLPVDQLVRHHQRAPARVVADEPADEDQAPRPTLQRHHAHQKRQRRQLQPARARPASAVNGHDGPSAPGSAGAARARRSRSTMATTMATPGSAASAECGPVATKPSVSSGNTRLDRFRSQRPNVPRAMIFSRQAFTYVTVCELEISHTNRYVKRMRPSEHSRRRKRRNRAPKSRSRPAKR